MTPLTRMLSRKSSVNARLPYNWNWQRRWEKLDDFLSTDRIVLVDVGARGVAPPELESLRSYVRRIGFEPDLEECQRLSNTGNGEFFPMIVGGLGGAQRLNLYSDRDYSSVYELADRYTRLWLHGIEKDSSVEAEVVTLDSFVADHPDLCPDFLKLDVQGAELAILQGGEQTLQRTGLVEVEVEFAEMYRGQPLFHDIAAFMSNRGFELLYLNRGFATRREVYDGPSRGQLITGDALFGKTESECRNMTVTQRAKYVILLVQLGHLDIAYQLVAEDPTIEGVIPQIRSVFKANRGNRWKRGALMQFDKILAVLLHYRRYNQLGTDSDRSWPIR
ncbi:MAG TPA: FkbM family methyltransferase [Candidatus Micrarchaeaceae archaeon]|nr:FkbM family methyltransferase [Candidatus Micrarchaeaceae archaeon]